MGLVQWLRNVWSVFVSGESEPVDRKEARDEVFEPEQTLYDLGYEMCTVHPDGILDTNVQQFNQRNMAMVVDRWFEYDGITTDDVRDLDRLLDESEPSFGTETVKDGIHTTIPSERKVHQLREVFFDRCTEDRVCSLISDLYDEERETFGLAELFDPYTTDQTVFAYEYPVEEPNPMMSVSEDDTFPTGEMTFETETKDLLNVGIGIDVVEHSVSGNVREFVHEQASMACDALDVDDGFVGMSEYEDALMDAHDTVVDNGFRPDTVVWTGLCPFENQLFGMENIVDETSTLRSQFVVADTDRVGFEVTARDVNVEYESTLSPNMNEAYTVTWTGNYVVTDDGAFAVP